MTTGPRICAGCDTEIIPGSNERNPRKWCSESCRVRAYYAKNPQRSREYYERTKVLAEPQKWCAACGDPVQNRANIVYCGKPACKKIANRLRMRDYFRRAGGNKHNTPERARAYYEKRKAEGYREEWTPAKRARSDRRKAAKKGLGSEEFSHLEVYERDGWLCGICADPVDAGLAWPDPFSPSLDHILPLSRGGDHTRANTRLSHLRCNVARGNRIERDTA